MEHFNPVLVVNLSLAQEIGLNEAIVLNQIHYWQKKCKHKWIYNSYEDWKKQFCFWSNRTIQRIFLSLEQKGLIESKRTIGSKFYKLSEPAIKKFFSDKATTNCHAHPPICRDEHAKLARSIEEPEIKPKEISFSLYNSNTSQESAQENFLRELIQIWNDKIGQKVELTKGRTQILQKVFSTYFHSEIQQWQTFVGFIAQSNFLMGKVKDFKVNFDWALSEPYINRILEGAYSNKANGDTSVNSEGDYKQKVDAVVKNIFLSINDPIWLNVLEEIQKYDGPESIYSWFRDAKYERAKEDTFIIKIESNFKRDYVSVRYCGRIRRVIADVTGIEFPIVKMTA